MGKQLNQFQFRSLSPASLSVAGFARPPQMTTSLFNPSDVIGRIGVSLRTVGFTGITTSKVTAS